MNRRELEAELKPKLSDRELKLILDWAMGIKSSAISRELRMSRERIGQIIERLTGERSPHIRATINHEEFKLLLDTANSLGITSVSISRQMDKAEKTLRTYKSNPESLTPETKAKYAQKIVAIINQKLQDIVENLDNSGLIE